MKKFFTILLAASVMLSSVSFCAAAKDAELAAETPILISTAQELAQMAAEVNSDSLGGAGKIYYLNCDISLENADLNTYIGSLNHPFQGTFDGRGHVIKDYKIPTAGDVSSGLFGAVSGNALIQNVGIENVSATAETWIYAVGGLVGTLLGNATVECCYAKNVKIGATTKDGYARRGGGLIGVAESSGASVKNCYAVDCAMNDSEVDEDGGIIGGIHEVNTVANCYSDSLLARCKDESLKDTVLNSYYVAEPHWPAECYAGERITALQLKAKAGDLGAAFTEDTQEVNGGYPILKWQKDERFEDGDATVLGVVPDSQTAVDIFGAKLQIQFSRFLDKKTVSAENITVTPAADFTVQPGIEEKTDSITIAFDTLAPDTAYTITFSDALKTTAGFSVASGEQVSFRTAKNVPDFALTKTTPEDGAIGVMPTNPVMKAVYNQKINFASITDRAVTVTPHVAFTVEKGNSDYELAVTFSEELMPNTEYTVTFSNQILSILGMAAAEKSVRFQTANGFSNLVRNGDMENTNLLSVFDDKNGNASILFVNETERIGTENTVLKFTPGWGDQPVISKDSAVNPGTYRMSAWVKTDETQEISLTFWCGGDDWDSRTMRLEAGHWQYLSEEFTVTAPLSIKEVSIRSVGGKTLYIDDWSIYDVSLAPDGDLRLASSSIEDGATEISPLAPSVTLQFSVPVRFDTLLQGITVSPGSKPEQILFHPNRPTECTLKFAQLDTNTQYTLDFGGIKSLKGKSVSGTNTLTFTTVQVKDTEANVTATLPADHAKGVSCNNIRIEICFDSPMDPKTAANIFVSPDAGARVSLDTQDIKRCWITLDDTKVTKNQTYVVTVPETVLTINGKKTVPYTFSFTTVTVAELVDKVNAALGIPAEMKEAVEAVYPEMQSSAAYDYIQKQLPQKMDDFYTAMAGGEKVHQLTELRDCINRHAFRIILDNVPEPSVIEEIICDVLEEGLAKIFSDPELLNADEKNQIIQDVLANKDKTDTEIYNRLITQVICRPFQSLRGAEGIEKLLKLAESSFTGENSISALLDTIDQKENSALYYKRLQGIRPTTLSDIKNALKNVLANPPSGGSSSGSSGGSGTRGSSGIGSGGGGSASAETSDVLFYGNPGTTKEADEPFQDLSSVPWARDSILKLSSMGILNGKEERKFAPDDALTRAEFAKIAVLVSGGIKEDAVATFSDLSVNDWSYPYIASAYVMNLIRGLDNGAFGGEFSVTREDMAVILFRMAKEEQIAMEEGAVTFRDGNDISDYARDAVAALCTAGIINGVGDGCFDPKGTATRAQAAVMFDRFITIRSRK